VIPLLLWGAMLEVACCGVMSIRRIKHLTMSSVMDIAESLLLVPHQRFHNPRRGRPRSLSVARRIKLITTLLVRFAWEYIRVNLCNFEHSVAPTSTAVTSAGMAWRSR
jgi:hypothetical protein